MFFSPFLCHFCPNLGAVRPPNFLIYAAPFYLFCRIFGRLATVHVWPSQVPAGWGRSRLYHRLPSEERGGGALFQGTTVVPARGTSWWFPIEEESHRRQRSSLLVGGWNWMPHYSFSSRTIWRKGLIGKKYLEKWMIRKNHPVYITQNHSSIFQNHPFH